MNKDNPIDIRRAAALLREGRVESALSLLDNPAEGLPALRPYRERLRRLREQYGYMADFVMRGLPDPQLAESVNDMAVAILGVADEMKRTLLAADAPTLCCSMVRTAGVSPMRPLAEMAGECRSLHSRLALASLAEDPARASAGLTRRAEDVAKEIFNRLWITHPLPAEDAEAFREILSDGSLPVSVKALSVSGLTLGLMEWYDERRMALLADAYASSESPAPVSVRALCGLLLGLWLYRGRPRSRALRLRLESLAEGEGWASDVRMVNMQMVRARDTERLTRKFRDELLPDMMRLRPEIEKLGRKHHDLDPAAMEENPEWAELLDKSGLSERLKEMQEIQEEGGDILMATFSQLKSFPFFNDPSNWFLPFTPDHSALDQSSELLPILDLLGGSAPFCDSDRYSMALSLSQIPPEQRRMVDAQLKMQRDQIDAMRASSLQGSDPGREALTVGYVRDLYRFVKLFRRKSEFKDPFALGLNLPGLPELSDVFDDADTLRLIGEFYFRRRYWEDACGVFRRLDLLVTPEAGIYQKMGHCLQSLGRLEEALDCCERADMLDPSSRWTRRRLAALYRALGRYDKALTYYRALEAESPDAASDVSLALSIGFCLVKLRRFDEALQVLFKAEYLGADSPKALRAIVWCTLLGGDYERCRAYTGRLFAKGDLTPDDYLNAGHLEMLTGHPSEAAERYAESIAARGFSADAFVEALRRDFEPLPALAALDPLPLGIVADRAIMASKGLGGRV